ncbi:MULTISPECIES: homocysteine S-methyltransferase family protein [unclassified Leifsonia]|uniref:homocysteine S-methyltransferase family protein n=1 Tax=unclassified Leifsonia TaxID=2663824 RepID=UPI001FFA5175|nr:MULTISPECIES: homocysteine S-methyltransferase family protein [unclassified Leifsonia]
MGMLDGKWVTDGGLETDLIFNHGIDLPSFAAFPILESADGIDLLRRYYADYAAIAHAADAGVLLETPTWRANSAWGGELGYDEASLDRTNRDAVALIRSVLADAGALDGLVSGCIGPRGDGYIAADGDADEAAAFHLPQVQSLADAGADLVHAMTMTGAAEAIGVVRAARSVGVPVSISFTVETDGRLPDASRLVDAIASVDAAAPADFYGVNCAHPTHLMAALDGESWQERLTFFRPNASTLSHAELDEMEELDSGDLPLLVRATRELLVQLPQVTVIGGCCGTDSRHVAALWASIDRSG